ncbi:MAG: carbohydrate ABC transporter permease [Dehalococcoidia bacterium]
MSDIALPNVRSREGSRVRTPALRRFVRRGTLYLVLTTGAAFMAFPFYWMLLTSVKSGNEALRSTPGFPSVWHFSNYITAWQIAPFARYFANTFLVCFFVVLGSIITTTLAGYAFARMEFYGKTIIFVLLLSTLMIPFESIIIPNFIILKHLHLLNRYAALIVPWLATVFGIFLMRQFFGQLPQDLFDSAEVDGAGQLRTLWSIALPLARGPVAAVSLFAFLGSWNSLLWPLIVTNSQNIRPIQLGLTVFVNEKANDPQLLMAASAFTIAPIVVLYFFAQRQFIEGFGSSGLKG